MAKKKKSRAQKKKALVSKLAKGKAGPKDLERLKFLEQQMDPDQRPNEGILDKLQDPSATQRQVGCATIGVHLFQASAGQAEILCEFLSVGGTVSQLMQLLDDAAADVAVAAAKTLRNYCLVGGQKGCAELARLGMVDQVGIIFSKSAHIQKAAFLAHMFSVLCNLASNLDDAVEKLVTRDVMARVLQSIEAAATASTTPMQGTATVLADKRAVELAGLEAASFLFVVTEDNCNLAESVLSDQASSTVLVGAMQTGSLLDSTRSACAGSLVNMIAAANVPPELRAKILPPVFTTLGQALTIDPLAIMSSMVATLSVEKKELEEKMIAEKKEKKETTMTQNDWGVRTEKRVFIFKQSAVCLTQTLEILTNFVASEGQEWMQPLLATLVSDGMLVKAAGKISLEINADEVTARCRQVLSAEETSSVLELLFQTRRTAVSCVSNFVLHLPRALTGDLSGVLDQACAQMASLDVPYGRGLEYALKEVDALTALIWNCMRKQPCPDKKYLQLLCKAARGSKSEEVRVNVAGALGCLGVSKDHFSNNFVIGSTLLSMLDACGLEAACEVVNSIIDIYSEDNMHTQQILQLKLLDKLAIYAPRLEQELMATSESNDEPLLMRGHESWENLVAFVEYKRQNA